MPKKNKQLNAQCHDCGVKIELKGDEIRNGQLLHFKEGSDDIWVFKCNSCYNAPDGKELKKFRNCEVYSRVVGYIRPVQGWNKGKSLEYKQRKVYDPNKPEKMKKLKSLKDLR
jgi:hypothetical protein